MTLDKQKEKQKAIQEIRKTLAEKHQVIFCDDDIILFALKWYLMTKEVEPKKVPVNMKLVSPLRPLHSPLHSIIAQGMK